MTTTKRNTKPASKPAVKVTKKVAPKASAVKNATKAASTSAVAFSAAKVLAACGISNAKVGRALLRAHNVERTEKAIKAFFAARKASAKR